MNAVRQGEWNLIAGESYEGRTQLATSGSEVARSRSKM